MKRLDDLTKEEILALADDPQKVADLIDLECAYQGLPLLPDDPGPKPEVVKPPKDLDYYEVVGVKVNSAEAAARILDVVTGEALFKKGYGDDDPLVPISPSDYDWPKIETREAYSEKTYAAIKDELKSIDARVRDWQSKKSVYDKALKDRQGISDIFWGEVRHYRECDQEMAEIKRAYARYLELSDGAADIALKFLYDAYSDGQLASTDDGSPVYVDSNGQKHELNLGK